MLCACAQIYLKMLILLSVFMCALVLIYKYLTYTFDYWIKRGVKGPKPIALVGNFKDTFLFKKSRGLVTWEMYEKYRGEKYIGLFNARKPTFLPIDLEVAKQILVKDFNYFINRGFAVSNDPLGDNLFNSDGDVWKVLRQKMTPVFSSGKLKNMFYLIHECGNNFQKYVGELVDSKEIPEIRDLMGRFTLEVICSCAFGIEVDSLKKGTNIFHDMGNRIFEPTWREFTLRFLDGMFPGFLKTFNLSVVRTDIVDFFESLVRQIVIEREGKPKIRHDFMDLILALREQGSVSGSKFIENKDFHLDITDNVMAAQAFIFFAAGFETSSGTMSFLLHELALNSDIQDKLRKEVNEVSAKYGGITYEALHEMNYLEMVFSEALRKYPAGNILVRECTKHYQLPGTKVTMDKGTMVIIPLMAYQRDPEYFPDPDKFDPERFSPEIKSTRHAFAYMPFGEGPRNCIGLRFAKVQSMLGIALLLQKFSVSPSSKTKQVLDFNPRTFTLKSADGIWLDIKRL